MLAESTQSVSVRQRSRKRKMPEKNGEGRREAGSAHPHTQTKRLQHESSFPMTTTQTLLAKRELAVLAHEAYFEVTIKEQDSYRSQTAAISISIFYGFYTKLTPHRAEKHCVPKTETSFRGGQGR